MCGGPLEAIRTSEAGLIDSCVLPDTGAGTELSSSGRQHVLVTAEPSSARFLCFIKRFPISKSPALKLLSLGYRSCYFSDD